MRKSAKKISNSRCRTNSVSSNFLQICFPKNIPKNAGLSCKNAGKSSNSPIGVNRPAIEREIPHFGLIPAFFQNVPHFWLYIEVKKSLKIAIILAVRRHFVRKSSAKTSVTASILIQKYVQNLCKSQYFSL